MLVEVENLKITKTFGEIEQDVLFGDTLRLETSKTSGCERLEKNTTSQKGVWGNFPHRKGCFVKFNRREKLKK